MQYVCDMVGQSMILPSFCACGGKNDLDHVLTCPVGGYTIMRHNALRDTEADLMKEVCRDVKIEPALIPIPNEQTQDQARCDISAQGATEGKSTPG